MIMLLIGIVCAVGGFIAGALVYRNNAKRAEGALQDSQKEIARLKTLIPK